MSQEKYKIAFMGTPEFSVKPLDALREAGHDVVAVYSQPPRPKDRGQKLQKSPVHLYAEEHNIPVFTPKSFKKDPDAVKQFAALNLDFAIVAAYGLLLPKSILEAPKYGCLNIHASLLPKWRGAAPIQYAILSGDKVTGITIMQMDEGLDTGDMLLKGEIPITPKTTATTLHDDLSEMGAGLIVKALEEHATKGFSPQKQDDALSTHAPKIKKEDGHISWDMEASEIDLKIRGLTPWPGVYAEMNGEKVKIHQAEICDENDSPGVILDDKDLIVACQKGALKITSIQRPGKSRVTGSDFMRGQHFAKGDRLK